MCPGGREVCGRILHFVMGRPGPGAALTARKLFAKGPGTDGLNALGKSIPVLSGMDDEGRADRGWQTGSSLPRRASLRSHLCSRLLHEYASARTPESAASPPSRQRMADCRVSVRFEAFPGNAPPAQP